MHEMWRKYAIIAVSFSSTSHSFGMRYWLALGFDSRARGLRRQCGRSTTFTGSLLWLRFGFSHINENRRQRRCRRRKTNIFYTIATFAISTLNRARVAAFFFDTYTCSFQFNTCKACLRGFVLSFSSSYSIAWLLIILCATHTPHRIRPRALCATFPIVVSRSFWLHLIKNHLFSSCVAELSLAISATSRES